MTLHPGGTEEDRMDGKATVGECLTLGGHLRATPDDTCSRCGLTGRPRPPAIPKAVMDRERRRHGMSEDRLHYDVERPRDR